jgi:hypothetical protein
VAEFLTLIVIVCGCAVLVYVQRLKAQTRVLTSHVVERLNEQLLRPIENRAFRYHADADGKRSAVIDEDSFRGLIEWVRQACLLLDALGTDRWGA